MTKYGPKTKLGLLCKDVWYDAWAGQWNQAWREGQTIEVEIESRDYQGKAYFSIRTPPEARKGGGVGLDLAPVVAELKALVTEIKALREAMARPTAPALPPTEREPGEEPPPPMDEELGF
ncbi:MAG: hypothetical protein QMD32_06740 [Smithellaceae bacterium]|nr:hypothetical protein [Smithellaceae bacterium]